MLDFDGLLPFELVLLTEMGPDCLRLAMRVLVNLPFRSPKQKER